MEEILHQLIGSLSHYLQGFIHPRWLVSRISSINGIAQIQKKMDATWKSETLPLAAGRMGKTAGILPAGKTKNGLRKG